MKIIQKWGGGGAGLLSLVLLFLSVPSAFAQTKVYIDPDAGTGAVCTFAIPCELGTAFFNKQASVAQFLIAVSSPGSTVELTPSKHDLSSPIVFGVYARTGEDPGEGTIKFTGARPFKIGGNGQVKLDAKAKVEFTDITHTAARGNTHAWPTSNGEEERITIAGTLELAKDAGNFSIGKTGRFQELYPQGGKGSGQ